MTDWLHSISMSGAKKFQFSFLLCSQSLQVLLQGADFEPCRSRCSLPGLTALLTPTQGNAYDLAWVKKTQGRLFVRRTVTLSTFFLFSLSAEELERGHKEGNAADC